MNQFHSKRYLPEKGFLVVVGIVQILHGQVLFRIFVGTVWHRVVANLQKQSQKRLMLYCFKKKLETNSGGL